MRADADLIVKQAVALVADERDPIANAANLAALLYHELPDINWAGFYFVRDDELVLGPFQGRTACTRIGFARGVCGTAWQLGRTIVVPDVHAFEGHIACDAASNAEIVVPIIAPDGSVAGVLDVDSPSLHRFDEGDRERLEAVVAAFVRASDLERR